ncbi:hypothetical protein EV211_10258 [Aminicella lysinilytica]|uniref:Uncharacterized protein n=2 Tax=Aminicella lysinilytica TaxID=433323 RepID=A0A4R6QCY2_9FIRM|nr:hypothetical protein EV211_10258 [Aminicella lysinilytica]
MKINNKEIKAIVVTDDNEDLVAEITDVECIEYKGYKVEFFWDEDKE